MEIVDQVAGIRCEHRDRRSKPPCGHCVGTAKRQIGTFPDGALELVARHFAGGPTPTPLCYTEAVDLLGTLRPYLKGAS